MRRLSERTELALLNTIGAVFGANRPQRDDAAERRADIRWGFVGFVFATVVVLVVGLLYFVQFGHKSYRADVSDAGSIRVGDEIRLAGITVGKVKSLNLAKDHVDMIFSVDGDVFVGDQTSVDIRMLTVVGGHYVALLPAGVEPLGDETIPAERVTLPYSLPSLFQDAVTPLAEVDGNTLRENFAVLGTSLDEAPESFRQLVDAVDGLTRVMDTQNADISKALTLTDEFVGAISTNQEVLRRIFGTLNTLETVFENNKTALGAAFDQLGELFSRLEPLGRAWEDRLKAPAQQLAASLPSVHDLGEKLGRALETVRDLERELMPLMTATGALAVQHSAETIVAPNICIPVQGRAC